MAGNTWLGMKSRFGPVLTLALVGACLFLQACESGSAQDSNPLSSQGNTPLPPPPPATPTVTIDSPANNAVVTSLPLTLRLTFTNATDTTPFRALLDGVDITSQFGPMSGGSTQAQVTKPAVNFGKNQLQVSVGSQRVSARFTYNPHALPSVQPGADTFGSSLPQLVPIQTRVLKSPTADPMLSSSWGIQLGNEATGITSYWAADGCSGACFQVVLLKRTDLSLVSNTTYATPDESGAAALGAAIAPGPAMISKCGNGGCLEIIQSLGQIGWTSCGSGPGGDKCQCPISSWTGLPDCKCGGVLPPSYPQCIPVQIGDQYGAYFTAIGGTSTIAFANGSNPDVAYSYIGNVGNGPDPSGDPAVTTYSPGVFFERVTCGDPGSSDCGNFPNGVDISNSNANPITDPTQIGEIAGALVLDNHNYYTFAQTAPTITFTMGAAPDATSSNPKNLLVINTPTPIAAESWDNLPVVQGTDGNPHQGGFHVAVFDATTFQNYWNGTYTILYNDPSTMDPHISNLSQLPADLDQFKAKKYLIFIASMGDLYHAEPYGNTGYHTQDIWDQVAQRIVNLGGTYITFTLLDHPDFTLTPDHGVSAGNDDYAMVGQHWIIESGVQAPYAAEVSSQISRQTSVNPVASNMQGVLKKDREGYYRPSVYSNYQGFVPDVVTTLAAASLLPPVVWPLNGPTDPPGLQAAYTWVSDELCCEDIRAAYVNLNAVPETWLAQLLQLTYDPDKYPTQTGFSADDFATVQEQLTAEFQYVALVRQFQTNVTALYADQQANVSLILLQAQDTVLGSINVNPESSSSSASWTGILKDVFGALGPVAGLLPVVDPAGGDAAAGIYVALGVGSSLLDLAGDHTNDSAGNPLVQQEQIETTVGALAQKAADEYAESLTSLGADFDRVVMDWGRLKSIGGPLASNLIPWNARATGILLQSFDLASRREYFAKIMVNTYQVDHLVYSAPVSDTSQTGSEHCDVGSLIDDLDDNNQQAAYAFWPGPLIDGPQAPLSAVTHTYPNDIWWDVWFLGPNGYDTTCPSPGDLLPSPGFQLFDPVDPDSSTPLGIYKPWFYQRSGFVITWQNNTQYDDYPQNGNPDNY